MNGSLLLIFCTSSQNFIAIKLEKPCLRRKYGDFQKVLSDPCLNIAESLKIKIVLQISDEISVLLIAALGFKWNLLLY